MSHFIGKKGIDFKNQKAMIASTKKDSISKIMAVPTLKVMRFKRTITTIPSRIKCLESRLRA
jgi:hypothetical protein